MWSKNRKESRAEGHHLGTLVQALPWDSRLTVDDRRDKSIIKAESHRSLRRNRRISLYYLVQIDQSSPIRGRLREYMMSIIAKKPSPKRISGYLTAKAYSMRSSKRAKHLGRAQSRQTILPPQMTLLKHSVLWLLLPQKGTKQGCYSQTTKMLCP